MDEENRFIILDSYKEYRKLRMLEHDNANFIVAGNMVYKNRFGHSDITLQELMEHEFGTKQQYSRDEAIAILMVYYAEKYH